MASASEYRYSQYEQQEFFSSNTLLLQLLHSYLQPPQYSLSQRPIKTPNHQYEFKGKENDKEKERKSLVRNSTNLSLGFCSRLVRESWARAGGKG